MRERSKANEDGEGKMRKRMLENTLASAFLCSPLAHSSFLRACSLVGLLTACWLDLIFSGMGTKATSE